MATGTQATRDRINSVQRQLGDPNQKRWKLAEIVQALNFADRDYCARTRVLAASESFTTTANQEAQALSTVYGVRSVHIERGTSVMENLNATRQPWPDETLSVNSAEPYLWWALRLYLPTTSVSPAGLTTLYLGPRSLVGRVLHAEGYGLPSWQADETGYSEIPEEFVNDPLPLAMARLVQRFRDWSASRELLRNYARVCLAAEIAAQRASFKGA